MNIRRGSKQMAIYWLLFKSLAFSRPLGMGFSSRSFLHECLPEPILVVCLHLLELFRLGLLLLHSSLYSQVVLLEQEFSGLEEPVFILQGDCSFGKLGSEEVAASQVIHAMLSDDRPEPFQSLSSVLQSRALPILELVNILNLRVLDVNAIEPADNGFHEWEGMTHLHNLEGSTLLFLYGRVDEQVEVLWPVVPEVLPVIGQGCFVDGEEVRGVLALHIGQIDEVPECGHPPDPGQGRLHFLPGEDGREVGLHGQDAKRVLIGEGSYADSLDGFHLLIAFQHFGIAAEYPSGRHHYLYSIQLHGQPNQFQWNLLLTAIGMQGGSYGYSMGMSGKGRWVKYNLKYDQFKQCSQRH